MLGERIARHQVQCWLVNTGWTGGPYGVGRRVRLAHTRAMLRAALDGRLDGSMGAPDPVFGVRVPAACPDVPSEILSPRAAWADPAAYDAQAQELARLFQKNFEQFDEVPTQVRAAGPHLR